MCRDRKTPPPVCARHRRPAGAGVSLVLTAMLVIPGAGAEPRVGEGGRLTPPGSFASLETHRLYYHCVGRGTPVVVIDTGIGGAAIEWTPVQTAVSRQTRVCTYDRAGYGWSDPGPAPRTTSQAVLELRRLLALTGEPPPYLLVGHSFGGFNMRYFAARYAEEVTGLVLVDSSHPRELPAITRGGHASLNGLDQRRFEPSQGAAGPYHAAAAFLNSRRKAVFAQMDELHNFAASAAEVEAAGSLRDLPLMVIARGDGDDRERESHWRSLQRSLVQLSTRGRFLVAASSGHEVHLARPDVIADAIRALLPPRPVSGVPAR